MRLMDVSDDCSSLGVSSLELIKIFQEHPTNPETLEEHESMETLVKREPPDVKMEDEVGGCSAIFLKQEEIKSDMEIMFRNVSEDIKEEKPSVEADMDATPCDDDEDPLSSDHVSEDRNLDQCIKKSRKIKRPKRELIKEESEENNERKKNELKQWTQTKAKTEDEESEVTEIICNVEIEFERDSGSDMEHEDIIPENQSVFAENLSLIPETTFDDDVGNNVNAQIATAVSIIKKNIEKEKKTHQCTYCNKVFRRVFNLNNHMLIHTCEKPHQCTYCNKGFTQKGHLKRHILIHTGEIRHQCSYCNKAYFEKKDLEQHISIHTGDNTNRCSICNKVFSCKGDLQRHILIHTGEKPHQCTYCNKCFTQKNNLKRHILIHTGEKPFWCSFCDKAFAGKGDLKRHVLIHTGERPHRCSICMKTFTHRANLNKHILLIHKKKKPIQENVSTKK